MGCVVDVFRGYKGGHPERGRGKGEGGAFLGYNHLVNRGRSFERYFDTVVRSLQTAFCLFAQKGKGRT